MYSGLNKKNTLTYFKIHKSFMSKDNNDNYDYYPILSAGFFFVYTTLNVIYSCGMPCRHDRIRVSRKLWFLLKNKKNKEKSILDKKKKYITNSLNPTIE